MKIESPQASTYMPALDGLRGLAVLAVIAFHFAAESGLRPVTEILTAAEALPAFFRNATLLLFSAGWSGVDLFFVLSGFLITGILWDTREAPHYARSFYMRRILRILPLYYATLVALWLVPALLPAADGTGPADFQNAAPWLWLHLTNLQIASGGAMPLALEHFWSLAVEEQFYLVWPWVVLYASRRTLMRICVALAVIAPLLRLGVAVAGLPWDAGYMLTPMRADVLAVGAWLALAAREPGGLAALVPQVRPLAVVSGLVLAMLAVLQGSFEVGLLMQVVGFSQFALLYGVLVLHAVCAPRAWMLAPALRSLGRYSYAMYVLHFPLLFWLLRTPLAPGGSFPRFALFTLTGTLATYLLAWCSWQLLEVHFNRLKRYFPAFPEPASAVSLRPGWWALRGTSEARVRTAEGR